jgi:hypothetical protein
VTMQCHLALRCAIGLMAFSTAISSGRAQVLYGRLPGNVSDPSSAAVPTAKVEATNMETGAVRSVNSDERGVYLFSNVQPGLYRVAVTAPSFRSFVTTSVQISANEVRRVDVQLAISRPATFQAYYGYQLPLAKGHEWLNHGIAALVLGGFQISGTISRYSGLPFTVGSNASVNAPGQGQTADQLNPVVQILGGRDPQTPYFDGNAFGNPPTGAAVRQGPRGETFYAGRVSSASTRTSLVPSRSKMERCDFS